MLSEIRVSQTETEERTALSRDNAEYTWLIDMNIVIFLYYER